MDTRLPERMTGWGDLVGEGDCPGGCGEQTPRIKMGSALIPLLCEPCQAKADADAEQSVRNERLSTLSSRSGIPPLMSPWTFTSYVAGVPASAQRAVDVAKRWIERYRGGARENLLIYGPVGSGKTGLVVPIVQTLVWGYTIEARFVIFRDLLYRMTAAFGQNVPFRETDTTHKVPVLVLDDLGAERPTDFARNELSVLIEHRRLHRLPTIVTSNYEPNDLAKRLGHDDPILGQRIVSRLVEDAVQFRVRAADRRKPQAATK